MRVEMNCEVGSQEWNSKLTPLSGSLHGIFYVFEKAGQNTMNPSFTFLAMIQHVVAAHYSFTEREKKLIAAHACVPFSRNGNTLAHSPFE